MLIGGHVKLDNSQDGDEPFQSFLINPRGHLRAKTIKLLKSRYRPFIGKGYRVIHSSYVTVPWSKNDRVAMDSLCDIEHSGIVCEYLNIPDFLLHLPSTITNRRRFEARLRAIDAAANGKVRLVFEGVAHKPSKKHVLSSGAIDKLHDIDQIAKRVMANAYAFCLDTAHLFSRGVPLTTSTDIVKLIRKLKKLPIAVIHLNGNAISFNKGRDKHTEARAFNDYIWGEDCTGLKTLLEWSVDKNIPVILERKKSTLSEYTEEITALSL